MKTDLLQVGLNDFGSTAGLIGVGHTGESHCGRINARCSQICLGGFDIITNGADLICPLESLRIGRCGDTALTIDGNHHNGLTVDGGHDGAAEVDVIERRDLIIETEECHSCTGD